MSKICLKGKRKQTGDDSCSHQFITGNTHYRFERTREILANKNFLCLLCCLVYALCESDFHLPQSFVSVVDAMWGASFSAVGIADLKLWHVMLSWPALKMSPSTVFRILLRHLGVRALPEGKRKIGSAELSIPASCCIRKSLWRASTGQQFFSMKG